MSDLEVEGWAGEGDATVAEGRMSNGDARDQVEDECRWVMCSVSSMQITLVQYLYVTRYRPIAPDGSRLAASAIADSAGMQCSRRP